MMPQMEANQPIHEQPSNAYGAYGGNRESTQQQYEAPYQQPPPQTGTLNNNFVEAVSQRIAQLMSQQSTSKVYLPKSQDKPPHGMQLALGIVSVIILLPLAGICLTSMESSIGGLIGFLIGCSAIICINLAFSGVLDFRRPGGIVK